MAGIDDAIDAARKANKAAPKQQTQNAPVSTNPNVAQGGDTQTPLQKQLAADPYPTVDPNASIGQHLLSAGQQAWRGVENVGRVGADALTRGLWDKSSADPAAARAKTEQASEELGTGGNLGIRTMASIPGRIFRGGGLLKAGVEGGINGAVDAYGHGGSPGDILWGGATGFGVGSGLSGVGQTISAGARKLYQNPKIADALKTATEKFGDLTGVNAPATPASVTEQLQKDASVKFKQLDQNQYYAPHVGNVADQADNVLANPVSRTAAPGTDAVTSQFRKDMWDKAAKGMPATAGDIHTQIKALGEVMDRGGFDGAQAKKAQDIFKQSYGGLQPTNGASSSAVVDQFNAANQAHGLFKNADNLQKMNDQLGTYRSMPGPAAKKMVQDNPGFYDQDQTAALNKIANSGDAAPELRGWGTAAGSIAGYGLGWPKAGALAGGGIDAMRYLSTPAGARRAIYNSYPAMTGQSVTNPEEMTSEALKRLGIGGLSAAGTPNPIDMTPGPLKPWVLPSIYGQ